MIISLRTQDLSFTEDISDLLCQIDQRLVRLGKTKLTSLRFGAKDKVDENQCFILVKYKEILLLKVNNSPCLGNYLLDDIISVIKQYLSTGKVHRFKKTDSIGSDSNDLDITVKVKFDVPIVYNFYNYYSNSYNTINNTNNVTNVDNTWDETSW